MPELPEVETMRRGLAGAVGSHVVGVSKLRCERKPIEIRPGIALFRRRVQGTTISKLDRAGKRVVIWLDSEDAIVLEPRMTGLVLVTDPPTKEHLRWQLKLAKGPIPNIFYWDRRGLGNVCLYSKQEFQQRYGPENLGPDALKISAQQFQDRLGNSRREIKPALLDQRAVAGIGNLYASEILHLAGIHPERRCTAMTGRQWASIATATNFVLETAIRYEGSTLSDGTYRNALNKEGGYQNQHQVYDKEGETCPRCKKASIRRIIQTQRSTYYCSKCQTKNGARELA